MRWQQTGRVLQVKLLALPNLALNLLRWSGDGWQLALLGDTAEFGDAASSSTAGTVTIPVAAAAVVAAAALAAAVTCAWLDR